LVECGETYHIKLAIGDAVDGAFDSAVFLQEGSFESSLAISAGLFSSIGPNLNGILYENCGFGTLTFNRSAGIDQEALVELELTGTGINGVDFTTIPDSFLFEAGDSVISLNVSAIIDNLDEGLEDVTLTITNTAVSACSGNITSEFTFFISDDPEPLVIESVDYAIDCGDTIVISADVTRGYGQYNYFWNPSLPNQPDPIVSPGTTTDYYLLVTDTCNSISSNDTINVDVPVYPPMTTGVENMIDLDCLEDITIVPDGVTGGNGVYTYEWYENGEYLGDSFSLFYTGGVSSSLTFIAIDGCGTQSIEDIAVLVEEIPLLVVASDDTTICAEATVPLTVDVSGGEEPYELEWSLDGFDQDTIVVTPGESTQYYISVTDLCGNVVSDDVNVRVADAEAFFTMNEMGYYGIEVQNFSTTANSDSLFYSWDFGDGSFSEEESPRHIFLDLDEHEVWLTVHNEYGCTDSTSLITDPPASIYVPSSFSPNGDGLNDQFFVVANELVDYELFIFDRWGRRAFYSTDQNEKWNGRAAQDSEFYGANQVYLYRLRARTEKGERYDLNGTITLFR
jgi:gliding motility-associated-like protein